MLEYIRFGKGKKHLVMLPGLSTARVKDAAITLPLMYHKLGKNYTVWVFDKAERIPDGYTVRDMARDVADSMESLGIEKADVFGCSQGGMIAQYFAIDNPRKVNKLVLAETASRNNAILVNTVETWINQVEKDDYKAFAANMTYKMYSAKYVSRYKLMIPLMAKLLRPKDKTRFINMAKACLTCNAFDELDKIKCPVFVIGGKEDKVVSPQASYEIADKLGCEIYMYDGLGHAAHEEAPDFNK
ncbi:MAG: alpha/beta hydrolase, partial [Clostridia bacterium]|nr:alpha/beta hydrolase [Clostridia bacterium]